MKKYDILLKNGHVIAPANNIDGIADVAVLNGKIAAVSANLNAEEAEKVIDVTGLYVNQDYRYYASVHFPKEMEGGMITLGNVTAKEFHDFYDLLQGKPQSQSYEDLFAPVYIMNAIDRAIQSGKEEQICYC